MASDETRMKLNEEGGNEETKSCEPFATADETTDLTIVVEGYNLYVQASHVFDAMLKSDFKEAKEKKITLPGKKLENVIDFLKFFYPKFESMGTECPNLPNVLSLCHEYDVSWLKNHIERFYLQLENVGKLRVFHLSLASQYDLNKLKHKILYETNLQCCFECVTKADQFEKMDKSTKLILYQSYLKRFYRQGSAMTFNCCSNCKSNCGPNRSSFYSVSTVNNTDVKAMMDFASYLMDTTEASSN